MKINLARDRGDVRLEALRAIDDGLAVRVKIALPVAAGIVLRGGAALDARLR